MLTQLTSIYRDVHSCLSRKTDIWQVQPWKELQFSTNGDIFGQFLKTEVKYSQRGQTL